MARRYVVAAVVLTALACGSPEPPRSPIRPDGSGSLDGLWEAKRRFGPDVRGPLTIEQRAGAWRADIAGHAAPVQVTGRTVAFELPDKLGSFEGELSEGGARITGHWIQPRGVRNGYPFASPVTMEKQDAERWRGEVRPLDDHMTVRLAIRTQQGSMRAFLRNPERNIGIFAGISRLERKGDDIALVGTPLGASGEETVARGSYDVESDVLILPLPGGTYDFRRADGETDSGFHPRGRQPARYRYAAPPALADGWPVSSVDEVGIDRAAIERFVQLIIETPMDSAHAPEIHALLIARGGKLVVEEYFHGFHRDEPHDTRSAAKSLTSILVGAAMQAGAPLDASTPVYRVVNRGKIPSGLDPRRRALTLEHLLTMSSGLDCDDRNPGSPGNENRMQEQTAEPDWYRYTLRLGVVRDPGRLAVYCSASPNLVGAVLRGATGQSLPRLFDRLVAEPLGIRRYHMNLMPTGDAYMGGGIYFLPRDFMKLGQLMLDRGEWNGKRIVSREWAERSTSPVKPTIEGGGARPGFRFGYLWWVVDLPYRERKVRAFYAGGNGGQVLMAIPDLALLVAFHGGNYSEPGPTGLLTQQVYIPKHVLPAVSAAH